MKIGELANASGVSTKMIRYYESIGLIHPAKRSAKGYRAYTEVDTHTLRFIFRCRSLGFSIATIQNLLALWQDRNRKSAEVRRVAGNHVKALQAKIEALEAMVNTLSHLIHCCHGNDRPECPILDELSGDSKLPALTQRLKKGLHHD
jgi:MerR family transcriptional regulator, copper efflux regulator